MLISVVIPTHYRPQLLEKLLASLEKQTLKKELYEVIIIQSPEDSAREVASHYSNKMKLEVVEIVNDPFKGTNPSAKRNYGVGVSRGEWIAFIDDDCIAESNWLESAKKLISEGIDGVEGNVIIPPPSLPTLTYKGLKRLSRSGGYQTCNIFYRKSKFEEVGGFDMNLPFYLEDTDLAWSILESGGKIIFSEDSIVHHPVPPSEPYRLITGAKRTEKLVYLFSKHPKYYRSSHMEAFRFSYRVYIFAYTLAVISIFTMNSKLIILSCSCIFILLSAHLIKMFKGCHFKWKEFLETAIYTLLVPPISLIYLFKGIFKYKKIPPL